MDVAYRSVRAGPDEVQSCPEGDAKRLSEIDAAHRHRYTAWMGHPPSSRVRTVSSNWECDIYVVRSTPAKKWLGTVEATDVDAAIAEAVWQFDVK